MWRLVRLFAGLVLLGVIVVMAEWLAPAAHGAAPNTEHGAGQLATLAVTELDGGSGLDLHGASHMHHKTAGNYPSGSTPAPTPAGRVAGSHPLDCIHWRVHQGSPDGPVVRVLVCSTIPKDQGGDSPARDSTNWANLFVDGDRFVTDGCGRSWTLGAGPCVLEGR